MKRSGFKVQRPHRLAKQIGDGYTPRPRAIAVAVAGPARATVMVSKERPVQNRAYMAAVRRLACFRCGISGYTQFCHADEGKGMGVKSDCRLGWPGCGPRTGIPGCHWFVGTSGALSRDGRREFESIVGAVTRAAVRVNGLWPASLPAWPGDDLEP